MPYENKLVIFSLTKNYGREINDEVYINFGYKPILCLQSLMSLIMCYPLFHGQELHLFPKDYFSCIQVKKYMDIKLEIAPYST